MYNMDNLAIRLALIRLLEQTTVEITFKKLNDATRKMKATLENVTYDKFQPYLHPTYKVWDVDKGDWRSFRWNRVKSFKVIIKK